MKIRLAIRHEDKNYVWERICDSRDSTEIEKTIKKLSNIAIFELQNKRILKGVASMNGEEKHG